MGFFGKKNKKEGVARGTVNGKTSKTAGPAKVAKTEAKTATTTVSAVNAAQVILRPRITEKSTLMADTKNVYVFEIVQDANKISVRRAIKALYNVTPAKVSIARNPSKRIFSRGKRGIVSGVKKAYVYLKKGDKIEII